MSNSSDNEDVKKVLKQSMIKIKDTQQMYDYISRIFEASDIDATFSYYIFKENELSFYDGDTRLDNFEVKEMINSFIYKKNVMGEIIPFEDRNYIVVPIFETADESEVLVLINSPLMKKFIEEEFSVVLKNIHIYRQLKLKCENLVTLSHMDEVTGLYNQRKLTSDLDRTIQSHKEKNESFSLMFVDIDHFKKVNDTYGHLIGSDILLDLGVLLKRLVRSTDDVYRFGGDEFIIILREVEIKTVHVIGVRILNSILEHDFKLSTGEIYKMSASIGIAEYPTDAKTSKEIIQLADNMMYESKKAGRGKVVHLGKEVTNVNARSK
jgi:diguanylate cyclase (GGDEF)-like protein